MRRPTIGVFGAGAIGAYVGIRLSKAGYPVTLLGRESLVAAADDLTAVELDGSVSKPGADLVVSANAGDLAGCDVCLVAVKSGDTESAGAALAEVLGKSAAVISLQNGLGNVERLRRGGLTQEAYAGMVSFNVRRPDAATFVKATDGPLMIERSSATEPVAEALVAAAEDVELRDDVLAVQTTKLLLNLNNGICALAGVPIAQSLQVGDLRWCFAMCLREGMQVMRQAGLPMARIGLNSPGLLSRVLLWPDFVVKRITKAFKKIDPNARSSTLQDLDAGKKTEIDYLNGEIVRLAEEHGAAAPANRFVVDEVHRLEESAETPPPFLSPDDARRGMQRAMS